MKFLVLAIAAVNLFLGTRCFLNLVHVLHSSKYATSTTAIFAVLFLGLGAASLWFAFWGGNMKLALWLAIGPWVLGVLVLFVQMVVGNPQ